MYNRIGLALYSFGLFTTMILDRNKKKKKTDCEHDEKNFNDNKIGLYDNQK